MAFLTFSLLFFLFSLVYADLQISASLDRQQMALNDQATLSVVISGNSSNLPAPQLPGLSEFQIYNAGTSQSFSWVNGQTSANVTYTYMLSPRQVGRFTIPPIRVSTGGQTAETPPMTLEVIKGNANAVSAPPRVQNEPAAQAPAQGAPGLFITATVDKSTVYVDEPVTLSFRLYRRVPILSQPQYQPPNTSGFWSEDLPPQRNYNANYKGFPYQVTEVRTALFPATPGKATIGPAGLRVQIQDLASGGDVFSAFFGGAQEKVLQTDPLIIHIKPLPDPKPAGFKGAVGRYTLASSLDKSETTVGQPVTLTTTISGEGSIKSLPDLTLPVLANVRLFDTSAAINIDKKDWRVRGSKVFKTILLPQTSGELRVPGISFVYFDPAEETYKTLASRGVSLHVKPAPVGSTPASFVPPGTSAAAPNVQVLGEDIRYIKTLESIAPTAFPLYRRKALWAVHGVALLALLGSGLFALYRRMFLSNPRLQRFRLAASAAFDALKKSPGAGTLSDILRNYLAAKLSLHGTGLALQEVVIQMQTDGVNSEWIAKTRELWETLDLYQFSPAQIKPEDLQATAQQLRQLIEVLEKEIVWKG